MNPRVYERLYGMRARLLAGSVALILLAAALLFSSRDSPVKPGEEATPAVVTTEVSQPPAASLSQESPVVTVSASAPPEATTVPTPDPEPVVVKEPGTEPASADSPIYTVRQGDCVWRIAESRCGSGFKWGEVYHANLDRIADPNLIYPDQEFTIPCGR